MVKEKAEKSIESVLWSSTNKIRGSVEPSEYKHVILSLIFLKYANDKFEEQKQKLIDNGDEAFIEYPDFYAQDNVFFVPEHSRWSYIMENAKQEDIAIKIDTALHEIETSNPTLAGALPDNYYSGLQLDKGVLGSLLDKFNDISLTSYTDKDIFGRIYEFCLSKFAIAEGKGKGEYYTPKSVVELLCALIEPYSGIVYDGACGSGGMFVQASKFIEEHKGDKLGISVYGQEYTATTRKLAMMNLAIRGISANFGDRAASTFQNDLHPDLKVDYALMNPPFNQKQWREDNELTNDARWEGYTTPPTSNANYAWILNMVSKLAENKGCGCLLLANGALSASGVEYEIRKQLIENDLVEAIIVLPRNMFYSTNISVTIWVFNKNKKARTIKKNGIDVYYRDRSNEVLFMDLRKVGHPFEKKYIAFSNEDIASIAKVYHDWQSIDKETLYKDKKEYCKSVTIETIKNNNYSLVTSKYIEFDKDDTAIDFDKEMKNIQTDIQKLLNEENKSKIAILKVMEDLGYGIKLS